MSEARKILILNWRSLTSPHRGGAEIATFEHARRWVSRQDSKVTWVSPPPEKGKKAEEIENVSFEYVGLPLNKKISNLIFTFPYFYLSVFIKYMFKYRKDYDVIIDQVHGLPYLTPLYSNKKIVVYIHEVAGDIWDKMYSFPINKIGKFLEKVVFIPYKRTAFVTVSEGSKSDLGALGIDEHNVRVVHNGVSVKTLESVPPKEDTLTVAFLNRVVKMKGIERALKAFSLVVKDFPEAKMLIGGKVDEGYKKHLLHYSDELGISGQIEFLGFLSEVQKLDMLSKSHVLVNPSYKEGWGLVNLEANCCGTPAVVFDVKGNAESVLNGVSGYIVEDDNYEEMKNKIISCYRDEKIRESSLEYSKRYNWNDASDKFFSVLTGNL